MSELAFNETIPPAVQATLHDGERVCPVFAGPALLREGRLRLRAPSCELVVTAPEALVTCAFDLCDGARTLQQVVDEAPDELRSQLHDFLRDLLAHGVMVDASLLTLHSSAYAHQGSPYGVPASRKCTMGIGRRFGATTDATVRASEASTRAVGPVPLSTFFAQRVSASEFGGPPVTEEALLQFLWSIAGVVSSTHERLGNAIPRRTIASAGAMHLLQVVVVLLQPVGGYTPGAYRVVYPAAAAVALRWIAPEHGRLPGAFVDPSPLAGATGAVFVSADVKVAAMRYRNRAVQYLFMEAGAALQNAGLTAPQLGMGFLTVGGYREDAVERLCECAGNTVLGSGIFGAATTAPSRP
jgi:ribosomal protein S12 methylthiotransferase accessory factor